MNLNTKNDLHLLSNNLRDFLISVSTSKKIAKGSYLFQEGMDAHELYLIKSGLVQVTKLTMDGDELSMQICSTNDIVGELTLYVDDAKYMLNASALEEIEVYAINKEILEKEFSKNPPLAFEYMRWMGLHLQRIQSKIRDLILNGKKGALYSTLIRLSNSYGVQKKDGILIDLHLTNQDLAKFCATTRESVNRMLSDLRKRKIITMEASGKMLLHDLEPLRLEIGCENCPIEICNIF